MEVLSKLVEVLVRVVGEVYAPDGIEVEDDVLFTLGPAIEVVGVLASRAPRDGARKLAFLNAVGSRQTPVLGVEDNLHFPRLFSTIVVPRVV